MDKNLTLRLRRLSVIPRWTTVPTIRGQNTAEHSFHVAWIAAWFGEFSKPNTFDLARLLWAAIVHDEPEAISGDIASPYKKGAVGEAIKKHESDKGFGIHGMTPLTKQELCILKMADLFEALLFIIEEKHLGNASLDGVYQDIWLKLDKAWEPFEWGTHSSPKPTARSMWHMFLSYVPQNVHPGISDV